MVRSSRAGFSFQDTANVRNPTLMGCLTAVGKLALTASAFVDGGASLGLEAELEGGDLLAEEGLSIAADEAGSTAAEETGSIAEDVGQTVAKGCGESFTADTKVLLASGAAIAISQLRPGDKVLATSTRTGTTHAETVAAVMVKRDTNLYDLTVKAGTRTAVIHTTANHLFWVPAARGHAGNWVEAGALRHGIHLRTPGGTATVVGAWTPVVTVGWMWDLTILPSHDFYIDTVATPVLVHNASCPTGFDYEAASQSGMRADKGAFTRAGREYAKHMGGNELPTVTGNPAAINSAGQDILNGILTDPGADYQPVLTGNFAGGFRVIGNTVTNGRFVGATFDSNGLFQYFGMYG